MLAHQLREMRDGLARQALLGAQLSAREGELDAVGRLLVGSRLRAILHVGDALAGERVSAQIGRRVVLVQPRRFLHAFEERTHAADVEARLLQELKADPVGLALEIAGVIEL